MIQSMTGFGRTQIENEQVSVSVEVKSLNSKFADCTMKMSHLFSDKEIEIRNTLINQLKRGKIIFSLSYSSKRADNLKANINQEVVKGYYNDLKKIADEIEEKNTESLLSIVMNLPEVYAKNSDVDTLTEDWVFVKKAIDGAVANCIDFRIKEGASLDKVFRDAIQKIGEYLNQVETLEPERIVKVREKLRGQVQELIDNDSFDPNRFEQELIFYIEKLDISEEKVRLRNHLKYFIETLDNKESTGKKLGFISQEIGREINTIGSKANDLEIQKLVVNMKEELEKIKEQILNVL